MSLVKSILKSIELYLALRNKLAFFEITEKHNKKKNEFIEEIEKLRAIGDNESSDRADFLRGQLRTENNQFKHISTVFLEAQGGPADSD
ncbi:hypothetical protein N9D12_00615 [Candidatus Pelagibacter sp.]|nr:hypothetical protein [Candidatus Pelagibacter sp.]